MRETAAFFSDLVRFRSLLFNLFRKDQKTRYRDTLAGFGWSFLHPLLLMGVFYLVFGRIGRFSETIPNYPLFLLAGLIPWHFFSGTLLSTAHCFRTAEPLILHANFPRQVVPLAGTFSTGLHLVFSLILYLVFLLFSRQQLTVQLLYLPFLVLLFFIFTFSCALIVSTLTVFFADLPFLLGIILTIGFYLSPIFYPTGHVPEEYLSWFRLNPMVHFLTSFHRILIYGKSPGLLTTLFITLFTCFSTVVSLMIFRLKNPRIPESL